MNLRSCGRAAWFSLVLIAFLSWNAHAQSCQTSAELEYATQTAIATTTQKHFAMAASGDVASLRQNAIPSLAADFSGIEATVKEHQPDLTGAQGSVKASFLLDASGVAPTPHAEFYCGVFGKNGQTANSAAFYLDNLPAGKYAVVLLDATSPKGKTMFSEILQQTGTDWKLAGLYIQSAQIAGRDSDWFLARARAYKAKGQIHNANLYFLQGISLFSRGLRFMSTQATDRLYDELQTMEASDLPSNGKTVALVAGPRTYKLSAVYPWVVGNDVDLFVKYLAPDISNTNQTYQDNFAVMKAIVTKYPEFRDAFSGVDAIAIDPSGRDYSTLLAMKDIK
jgi:hypothetical protein